MKKCIVLIALFLSALSISATAQIRFSINLTNQPDWGPAGYDYAQYYYIPAMDAYYDVNRKVYIYQDNGQWVTTSYVPARYRDLDLYRVHKVVINEPNPWLHHNRYRNTYWSYRSRYDQTPLRDRYNRENRYERTRYRNYNRYERNRNWNNRDRNWNNRGRNRNNNERDNDRAHDHDRDRH